MGLTKYVYPQVENKHHGKKNVKHLLKEIAVLHKNVSQYQFSYFFIYFNRNNLQLTEIKYSK